MATQIFETKEMQSACTTIHNFFDWYNFDAAVKETERIIMSAAWHRFSYRSYPYHCIEFMNKLQDLVAAAFVIRQNYLLRAACVVHTIGGVPDLTGTQNFTDHYSSSTVWNNIPRHLTAMQYADPFIAIEKFTGYATEAKWKETCNYLAEYALCNEPVDAQFYCFELLNIRLHLLRLIEACHLLEVRRNKKKKKKMKKGKIKE